MAGFDGLCTRGTSVTAKKPDGFSLSRARDSFLGITALMEHTPKNDAPICPQCKKPMEPGRPKVEGFPYLRSFECWPCLEVITKADDQ